MRACTDSMSDESAHSRIIAGGENGDRGAARGGAWTAGRCGQAREGEAARAHRGLGHGGAGGPRPVGDGGLENVLALRGGRHLRAQERRAEVGARAHRGGCHCQVGEKARNGVCEVSGRVKEAGDEARFIGSRGWRARFIGSRCWPCARKATDASTSG